MSVLKTNSKPAGLLLSPRRATSALLRFGRAVSDPETWHEAYWTAIDDAPASECLGIVARIGKGAGEWRIKPVAVRETFRSTSRAPRSTIEEDSCSAFGSRSPLRVNQSSSS